MRMSMRRFTRLTNAFPNTIDNHDDAIAMHDMCDDFCHIHKSPRGTPGDGGGRDDGTVGDRRRRAAIDAGVT